MCNRMVTLFERSKELLNIQETQVDKSDFSLVFMGDSWAGDGHASNSIFIEALKEAKNHNPLCIVHGGDAVWTGSPEQIKDGWKQQFQNGEFFIPSFLNLIDQEVPDIPVFVVPGNHDSEKRDIPAFENFKKFIGPDDLHFTIDVKRLKFRLIGLYTDFTTDGVKTYLLTDSELDYLKSNLTNAPKNTFVALHVPPSAGKWKKKFKDVESTFVINANEFLDIIEDKVAKALVSHVHLYDTAEIKDTEFILSGGAGAPLVTNHKFHIVVIRIKKGKISHKIVPIGWSA